MVLITSTLAIAARKEANKTAGAVKTIGVNKDNEYLRTNLIWVLYI